MTTLQAMVFRMNMHWVLSIHVALFGDGRWPFMSDLDPKWSEEDWTTPSRIGDHRALFRSGTLLYRPLFVLPFCGSRLGDAFLGAWRLCQTQWNTAGLWTKDE